MYVEGLVHITELGGEYFRFDEGRQELRGERTGIRYALGSRVQVQVSRVDLDGRRIDFRLVSGNDDVVLRAMRDKTGGPSSAEEVGRGRERSRQDRSGDKSSSGKAPKVPGGKSVRKQARGAERGLSGKSRKGRR